MHACSLGEGLGTGRWERGTGENYCFLTGVGQFVLVSLKSKKSYAQIMVIEP